MSDNTERLIAELHAAAGDSPDDADWMEDLCNRAASALRAVVTARAADAEEHRWEMARVRVEAFTTESDNFRGRLAAMEAERDALAQQIAAVRVAIENWRAGRVSGETAMFGVTDILDLSPVTPESRARLTARNLPQRSQHDFDIATGRPLGPGATPEGETNDD